VTSLKRIAETLARFREAALRGRFTEQDLTGSNRNTGASSSSDLWSLLDGRSAVVVGVVVDCRAKTHAVHADCSQRHLLRRAASMPDPARWRPDRFVSKGLSTSERRAASHFVP
jgi:hypothetical protein